MKSDADRALAALDSGDTDEARHRIVRMTERFAGLQDYSVSWVARLLTFIGRELGEEAVERALREFGETYLRDRRGPGANWWALPAEQRARVIAGAMLANGSTVEVDEDDEKVTLSFRCGTGGRLIDEGRYEGDDALLTLREPSGRTFSRVALPVYCAHCSVNNEIQPIDWDGIPVTVEDPPTRPGEACVHRIYRDPADIPAEVYERLELDPPR